MRVTKKGTIALLSFDDAARALAQEGFVASSKNHFKKSVRQRQKQHLRDAQRALVTVCTRVQARNAFNNVPHDCSRQRRRVGTADLICPNATSR